MTIRSIKKESDEWKSNIISGGAIVGIMIFLKEIVQCEKQIKSIDHGDQKLLFRSNYSRNNIFVLIVIEDLIIFSNI